MMIGRLQRLILILAAGLLAGCGGEFSPRRADALFASDAGTMAAAVDYCIRHRAAAESYLLAAWPERDTVDRSHILFALQWFGEEKTAMFMCRQIRERSDLTPLELNVRLHHLVQCLQNYDWGGYFLDRNQPVSNKSYPRRVEISDTGRAFIAGTMDLVEPRVAGDETMPLVSENNLRRIDQIRLELAGREPWE